MQKNMKRFMMLVAFSAPACTQAGSANLVGIYNKMDSLENAMTADAAKQNLSKTYSGKLDTNLEQLNADLQAAVNLANKTAGSIRGSSSVNNMELLIRVTLAAVDTDTLNGFSEAARRNLRDTIGNGLGGYGELEDDANEAMDALDESLGEDTTLNANPNYMRKDSPVARKVFKDRRHVTRKQRRQRTRQSAWESNQGGQSRREGGSYQFAAVQNNSRSAKPTRAERQDASKKRGNPQADEADAFKLLRARKDLGGDVVEETRERSKSYVKGTLRTDENGKVIGGTEISRQVETPEEWRARVAKQKASEK